MLLRPYFPLFAAECMKVSESSRYNVIVISILQYSHFPRNIFKDIGSTWNSNEQLISSYPFKNKTQLICTNSTGPSIDTMNIYTDKFDDGD